MNTLQKFNDGLVQIPKDWLIQSDLGKMKHIQLYDGVIRAIELVMDAELSQIDNLFLDSLTKSPVVLECYLLMLGTRYNKKINDYIYGMHGLDRQQAELDFFYNSGLRKLFLNKEVSSLLDYLKGVEIGLDSHARKNRTGNQMEEMLFSQLSEFCLKHGYFLEQNAKLSHSPSYTNKFDFVIYTPLGKIVIESNQYESSGSKMKATAKEYADLNKRLKADGVPFIWVTNGLGWWANQPLIERTIAEIPHFISLGQLTDDYLYEMCNGAISEA